MSYILDALKKVEHEKARKTKTGGITSISGDLFQERVRRPSSSGARKTAVVIVIASLVTFAAAWFILKGDKKKGAASPPATVTTVVTAPARLPSPPTPVTAPTPAPLPAPPQTVAPKASASAVTPPKVVPQPAAVSNDLERAGRTEKRPAIKPSAQPRQQKKTVQTIPAPADIKLSGIAWQDERSARRVVINGFLLQEGATVSGAKISEIHQDRVRFESPAGIFDLRMDAATPLVIPK